jgi:hypothetical protein
VSPSGTAAYHGLDNLPPLVTAAVDAAEVRLAPDLAALVATRRWPA